MQIGLIGWAKRIISRPAGLYILLAVLLSILTIHNLGRHPAGMDVSEAAAKNASQTIGIIKHHPVNAPHNLLALGLHKTGLNWLMSLRLSSLIFGLMFVFAIAFILWSWFGREIGLMGALLFIATPLFLIAARQGTSEIMYFCIAAIMAVYIWTLRARNKDFGLISLFIVCAVALYTPGVAIWLAGAAIISRKKISDTLSLVNPPAMTAAVLLSVLILAPMAFALISDWHIIKDLVPLPVHFAKPLIMVKETAWMALAVFFKTPYHTDFLLARLPILNIVQDALLVFGAYALWQAANKKLLSLSAGIIFAILAAGVNNDVGLLALAVPLLAVIVCAGLRYLYIEWLGVFPLNPVARGLAYTLLATIVIIQLLFGIRYAVVAWPDSSNTKSAYVIK